MTTSMTTRPVYPTGQSREAQPSWFAGRLSSAQQLSVGAAAVVILFALSVAVRFGDFKADAFEPNIEAPYHVLNTVNALNALPVSESYLLPSVTLGNERDKGISWGLTVPTNKGVYIYTSFPPIGFVAPFLAFRLAGVEPSLTALTWFNTGLGLMCALLLFYLLYQTLSIASYDRRTAIFCAIAGTMALTFSREALHSFGVVYWHQSVEQIWLLAQLIAMLQLYEKPSRGWTIVFGVVSFLSASTEWSGILGNILLAGMLLVLSKHQPARFNKRYVWILGGTTVAAVVMLLVHLFIALGIVPTLHALVYRFAARSVSSSRADFASLLRGYADSFGLFLVLAFSGALWLAFSPRKEARGLEIPGIVVLAAMLPVLENLVMLQHAIVYTFDRLKLSTALALVIGLTLANAVQHRSKVLPGLLLICALSAAQNATSFYAQKTPYAEWPAIDASNTLLKDKVAQVVPLDCAMLGSNVGVRGYINALFKRSIHEGQPTPEGFFKLASGVPNCGAVYLQQHMQFLDIPTIDSAIVRRPDGTSVTIKRSW